MSIFDKQPNTLTEQEITILEQREQVIRKYREKYGCMFVGVQWKDPDDPFCTEGKAVFKIFSKEPSGVVFAPYIPLQSIFFEIK